MTRHSDSDTTPGEAAEPSWEVLREPGALHHKYVYRHGDVVVRETGPWRATVHSLLRHLEEAGFNGSPRLVGSGVDSDGREILRDIEGEFTEPGPWSLEGAAAVGQLVRELHDATVSYRPPADAIWSPWFGRPLGGPGREIGHCDVAPWNIVVREGLPVAFIDWDFAGPINPLVDLAQACWLNAKLYSDDVADQEGLPPLAERARQLSAMVGAYGLTRDQRRGFVDRIIEFAVHVTAWEADDADVTHESTAIEPMWALAWRSRSAAWMLCNRATFENALS